MRPGMHTPRESGARLALDAFFENVQRSLWKRLAVVVVGVWFVSFLTAAVQVLCATALSALDEVHGPRFLPTFSMLFAFSLGFSVMLVVPALFLLTGTVVRRSLRFVLFWSIVVAPFPVLAPVSFGGLLWWLAMVGVMIWAHKRHPILVVLEEPWRDLP